ncbi:unnamed protein product [Calypogeia fissa]
MARGQGTADWGEQGLAAGAAAGIAFVSFGGGKREGCGREEPRLASSRSWWTFTKGDGGGRMREGEGRAAASLLAASLLTAEGEGRGGTDWERDRDREGMARNIGRERDRRGEGSRGGGTGRALLAPEQKGSCLWRGQNRGGG